MRFSILVVVAALLVLAGCDNSHHEQKNHQAKSDNPSTPVGQLHSHTESLNRKAPGCDSKDCPQVSIQWVQFDGQTTLNDTIRKRLLDQLSSNLDSQGPQPTTFKDAAEAFLALTKGLPDGAGDGWELSGSATRLDRRGNVLTLELSSYEFTGGAHGMPATHWLNWDLGAQKALPLSAIIKPGQEKAFWDLARQAHAKWLKNEANADENFRKAWPFEKTADYRLTDDGVQLLYDVYTIAPYVMGEPELTIPWDQAKAVIRPRFQPGAH